MPGSMRGIMEEETRRLYPRAPEPPEPPAYEPPEPERKPWHRRWTWRILIALALLVLFTAWRAGTFDHVLYNVGLNAKECARNGFGAVFCGQELTEYRERVARGKEEGEAAQHKIEEASKNAERESQEASKRAERESQEAQHRSEEALKRSTEETERQTEGSATPESG